MIRLSGEVVKRKKCSKKYYGTSHVLSTRLRGELIPLVHAICDQPPVDDDRLRRSFAEAAQFGFGLSIAKQMGYDLERGRLDKTPHPFCTRFSAGDVRITTRVRENHIGDALFSTLHEAGHAMYEQGVDAAYEGTPLGRGILSGIHESQSRLWENVVARSRPFWEHYEVSSIGANRAIPKVRRSSQLKAWPAGAIKTPFAKMVRSVDPLGKVPSASMDDNRGCRANASTF